MKDVQPSFTDVEYGMRRRTTRRETFLAMMDEVIPWQEWIGSIEPHYYKGERGRRPRLLETMLRMYLLQLWFSLSDEGVEEAIYDSHAMRAFTRLDFSVEQAPDATPCCISATSWRSTISARRCSRRRTGRSRRAGG